MLYSPLKVFFVVFPVAFLFLYWFKCVFVIFNKLR